MKKILSLFLMTIFISSCSVDWDGSQKNKIIELEIKIKELKNKEENDQTQKKQDCVNIDVQKMSGYSRYIHRSLEFFYSNTLDSCLWQYELMPTAMSFIQPGKDTEYTNSIYEIKDIWNSKVIFSSENKKEFLAKIEELKG